APELIARGAELYSEHCSVCHGSGGVQQRSSFPNLTLSPLLHAQAGFDQVVLNGARVARGMANYSDRLTAADSEALRAYVVARANELLDAQPAPSPVAPAQSAAPEESRDVHEDA